LHNGELEQTLSIASHNESQANDEPEVSSGFPQVHESKLGNDASQLDRQLDDAVRDVDRWLVASDDTGSFSEAGSQSPGDSSSQDDPAASVEEQRIGDSFKVIEQQMLEFATARQQIESKLLIKLETEAKLQSDISRRRREEEDRRRQAEEEMSRRREEDEQKLRAQRVEVIQTEHELKTAWAEERRLRAEVVRLKQLAHEALLTRFREEETAKLALLSEAQRSRDEAEQLHVDSLAKLHSEEASLRIAVERFGLLRAEVEAERQEHESETRRLEEERNRLVSAQAARIAEQTRMRAEAEEKLRLAQVQLAAQEADLTRFTETLSERRRELEGARQRAEEDARRLADAHSRMQAAQEASQQTERERLQLEGEIFSRAEAERRLMEDSRTKAEEQRQQLEANARDRSEWQQKRLEELETIRAGIATAQQVHTEKEAILNSELESLQLSEQATLKRIAELEEQRRAASESHERMIATLKRVEEQAQARAIEETQARVDIERRIKEETEQLKRSEKEHRQRIEEEISRRTEAESRLEDEKNRYQVERAARIKSELRADLGNVIDPTTPIATADDLDELVAKVAAPIQDPHLSAFEQFYTDVETDEPADNIAPVYQVGDLSNSDPRRRADAVTALARLGSADSYNLIIECFDDESSLVRNAAARAMLMLEPVRPAESFTRALKDSSDGRRSRIGKAIAESGLATQALKDLCSQDREETYNGLCLLFTMARSGEVEPLVNAIEKHEDAEVRLAAIRLLKMSGQEELATEAVNRRLRPKKDS